MRIVFEALEQRDDVTLTVSCTMNGKPTDLTVPAGAGLLDKISGDTVSLTKLAEIL